jgi:outer membrane protein insertion porin family
MPWFNSYYDIGRHNDSRIAPAFAFNTVDNPMLPHSGMRVTGSVQIASKALNGSYNYTKQEGEVVLYWPTSRRTGFGLRAEGGWLRQYGKLTTLPYYLRYFLGGEYQIRGYDIRTVGPIDSSNRALGGNKFVLFNAEYYIDVVSAVRMVLYHDAGQAFAEGDPVNLRLLRTSSGAEVRILVPMLNVPFRLIWAYNRYRDSFQPEFAFKFGVGATF